MTVLRCINDLGEKFDLDLLENIPFKLDISAIESGNIGQAFGVSSQQLVLPPSKINNEFFGNLYDVGATPATSFIKTVPCQVLDNGIEIFTGKLYLQSITTDNRGNDLYNVVVVNETVDLAFLIKDTTFGDLDFSSLNHTYTYGNITSSWDQTLEDGAVFYPLVNYGFDEDSLTDTQIKGGGADRTFTNYNTPIQVNDFKPAIRIRDCLDAIFSSVNYSYTSSLFSSGSYTDDIYLLASKDDKRGISSQNPISQSFLALPLSNQDYTDTQATAKVFFDAEQYDNGGNYDDTTSTFTADQDGLYQFSVTLGFEILNYNNVDDARQVTLFLYKNGSQLITPQGNVYKLTEDLTGNVNGTLNWTTGGINLDDGDTIEVYLTYTETASGTQTFRVKPIPNSSFELLLNPNIEIGGNVDLAVAYSDISVPDFLQGLIEKFNLVIEPVRNERNVIRIETFNDWIDAGRTVDWTDKVDYNKKWEIAHPLQNQPKNIKFTDEEDSIALTQYHKRTQDKIYGEFDYISESDLAEGEKTIGSFFAPTPIKGIDGAPFVILPALAEKDDSSQPYKRIKFAPRLVYHNGRQDIVNMRAVDSSGNSTSNKFFFLDEDGITVHTETDYGLASHLSANPANFSSSLDLHFGNTYSPGHYNYHQNQWNGRVRRTAFEEYWSFYINELYDVDSRLVTLNIFLDPTELPEIELNDKIHIDGHYYRINRISGANVLREDSVAVELIKTLPRKLKFPRRRIFIDDEPVDITVDDASFSESGLVSYEDFETGASYTGSAVPGAAQRDGFQTYGTGSGTTVIWNTLKPTTARFTAQTNIGLNAVDESAETIDTRGNGNNVANQTSVVRVEGNDNNIEQSSKFITVTGTKNTIEQGVENSAIQQSTTSSISENTTLSTIIGGENTIISGSNKSVAIGQDLTVQGGNSNIAIGNFDNNNRTIKDLINTVTINPNRDLESWENLGGDDFNGRAYMGTHQTIGAVFADNKKITMSAGQTLWLTGSDYANDYIYDLAWSGGSGTADLYLPSTDPSNVVGRDSQGYKRMLRFIGDNTLSSSTKININVSGSDSIDGASGGFYEVSKAYEGIMLYAPEVGEWFIIQKKA